jgi:xanthine dehydrogenase molybdopterin-binding subunit B
VDNIRREGEVEGMRFAGNKVMQKACEYFSGPQGGQMQVHEVAVLLRDLAQSIGRDADSVERR